MAQDIFDRINHRIYSMGLSDEGIAAKVTEYETLREEKGHRLSALTIAKIAEDLMVSFNWLVAGELGKWELATTVQNVRCEAPDTQGSKDWRIAQKALYDPAMAYQQVDMERSSQFAWVKLMGSKKAMEKFAEWDRDGNLPDFPGVIEQCFGIDVFILNSDQDFDAVGAMIAGSPFIVVKSGVDAGTGNEVVSREAARILANRLYISSAVYPEKDAPNTMEDAFVPLLTGVFNTMSGDTDRSGTYLEQRFPPRVVAEHRKQVAEGKNLGYFLEWMTGEPNQAQLEYDKNPVNLDDLAKLFGF